MDPFESFERSASRSVVLDARATILSLCPETERAFAFRLNRALSGVARDVDATHARVNVIIDARLARDARDGRATGRAPLYAVTLLRALFRDASVMVVRVRELGCARARALNCLVTLARARRRRARASTDAV